VYMVQCALSNGTRMLVDGGVHVATLAIVWWQTNSFGTVFWEFSSEFHDLWHITSICDASSFGTICVADNLLMVTVLDFNSTYMDLD
jgi:hypothetical protein